MPPKASSTVTGTTLATTAITITWLTYFRIRFSIHSMTRVEFSWIKVEVEWPLRAESSEAEERAEWGPSTPAKCLLARLSRSTDTARKSLSLEAPCSLFNEVSSKPSWFADLERVLENRRRIDVNMSPRLVLLRPRSVYQTNIFSLLWPILCTLQSVLQYRDYNINMAMQTSTWWIAFLQGWNPLQ